MKRSNSISPKKGKVADVSPKKQTVLSVMIQSAGKKLSIGARTVRMKLNNNGELCLPAWQQDDAFFNGTKEEENSSPQSKEEASPLTPVSCISAASGNSTSSPFDFDGFALDDNGNGGKNLNLKYKLTPPSNHSQRGDDELESEGDDIGDSDGSAECSVTSSDANRNEINLDEGTSSQSPDSPLRGVPKTELVQTQSSGSHINSDVVTNVAVDADMNSDSEADSSTWKEASLSLSVCSQGGLAADTSVVMTSTSAPAIGDNGCATFTANRTASTIFSALNDGNEKSFDRGNISQLSDDWVLSPINGSTWKTVENCGGEGGDVNASMDSRSDSSMIAGCMFVDTASPLPPLASEESSTTPRKLVDTSLSYYGSVDLGKGQAVLNTSHNEEIDHTARPFPTSAESFETSGILSPSVLSDVSITRRSVDADGYIGSPSNVSLCERSTYTEIFSASPASAASGSNEFLISIDDGTPPRNIVPFAAVSAQNSATVSESTLTRTSPVAEQAIDSSVDTTNVRHSPHRVIVPDVVIEPTAAAANSAHAELHSPHRVIVPESTPCHTSLQRQQSQQKLKFNLFVHIGSAVLVAAVVAAVWSSSSSSISTPRKAFSPIATTSTSTITTTPATARDVASTGLSVSMEKIHEEPQYQYYNIEAPGNAVIDNVQITAADTPSKTETVDVGTAIDPIFVESAILEEESAGASSLTSEAVKPLKTDYTQLTFNVTFKKQKRTRAVKRHSDAKKKPSGQFFQSQTNRLKSLAASIVNAMKGFPAVVGKLVDEARVHDDMHQHAVLTEYM
jgi:hypothetical protein